MTSSREQPPEGTERTRTAPVLATAAAALSAAGVGSPRADAEWLAAYVLDVARSRLPLTAGFTADELARYRRLVDRRAGREPLQHLLGSAAFRHLELAVGPGVFVPRPETELLAEWGIGQARRLAGHTAPVVVDLCSGSGAIALSVAQELPGAVVYAVERSARALDWLRRNAADRAAAGDPPIRVVAADVTAPDLLAELTGRVDVLLCNPPYVPAGTDVPPEVADHDPADAVFGGADGLAVIRPVVARAAELLAPGGVIGIEHDDTHPVAVPALLTADGRYVEVTCHADLTGRPRFSTARRAAAARPWPDPAPPASPAVGAWQTLSP